MANEEHVALLKQGVDAWNAWLQANPSVVPDLSKADLSYAYLSRSYLTGAVLSGANLSYANLSRADLSGADLSRVNLTRAVLSGAELSYANLSGADLTAAKLFRSNLCRAKLSQANLHMATLLRADLLGAALSGASLRDANLQGTNLDGADLSGSDISGAVLVRTNLVNLDLSRTAGLEHCSHGGPSVVDIQTLQKSGPLPLAFLRGVGLPDMLIDYLPSLLNQAIQFYSCFISYSSVDHEFAERLCDGLQAKGVRCWYAPHDMQTGARILDAIDEGVRLREKVLVILSESSIASEWVEREVMAGLEEECQHGGRTVLFPIRIDDSLRGCEKAWVRLLRRERHIGDFTRWKEHDAYCKAFERLLHDLKKTSPRSRTEAPQWAASRHPAHSPMTERG